MALVDEFCELTKEYDNRIFEIFRRIIDTAIKSSIDNKLDAIDRYVLVNMAIENGFKDLAFAKGIIRNPDAVSEITPPVSDELLDRIYKYTEPLVLEAREIIKLEADKIMEATDVGDLMNRYEKFIKMLEEKSIINLPYLYDDLEIKKRVK